MALPSAQELDSNSMAEAVRANSTPPIFDIQQATKDLNLKDEIITGLRSTPKYIPSILLWTAEGLKLFDKITKTEAYYPIHTETGILKSNADDIAKNIPSESVIVELGSGNLKKTLFFLQALARQEKTVDYFALDLSKSELQHTLSDLARAIGDSPFVRLHGLFGSYEDVVLWLQENSAIATRPKLYLWMGNSIANAPPEDAVSLLSRLADVSGSEKGNPRPSFLIAVDDCQDPQTIERCYSVDMNQCGKFILTSMQHVNKIANHDVFQHNDWALDGIYHKKDRCYRSYCVARRAMTLHFAEQDFLVTEGEYVRAMRTFKWDIEQIESVCKQAGLKCGPAWRSTRPDYGIYLLKPVESDS